MLRFKLETAVDKNLSESAATEIKKEIIRTKSSEQKVKIAGVSAIAFTALISAAGVLFKYIDNKTKPKKFWEK